jgi:hypothetical protein
MICFDSKELKQIFEFIPRQQLVREILKSGYSGKELMNDKTKMEEVVDKVKLVNNKEEKEIFLALYSFSKFYSNECKICFLLNKGTNPKNIDSLNKLRSSLKEDDLTDFLLWHDTGVSPFQLKAYMGKIDASELFEYLKKKLFHYGNDLGETNLLINLQSKGDIPKGFFQDLSKKLKTIALKGTGHILISYNEEDKFDVINTVYPTLKTTRIPREKSNSDLST